MVKVRQGAKLYGFTYQSDYMRRLLRGNEVNLPDKCI